MSNTIDFYYDYSSPNAYFSSIQIKRLANEFDVEINWEPVFLGGIMDELDTTPPAMQNKLKADYMMKDLKDWSDFYDIPFNFPEDFPLNSLPALRSTLVLEREEDQPPLEFIRNVFRALWVEDRDISDPDNLVHLLPDDSVDEEYLLESIGSDEIKDELKDRTDKAMERGVFGCPTFFANDEMFWGKDRLQFVGKVLSGR